MDLAEILNERLSLSWHEYSAVVGRWSPDVIPSLFPRRPHARIPDLYPVPRLGAFWRHRASIAGPPKSPRISVPLQSYEIVASSWKSKLGDEEQIR